MLEAQTIGIVAAVVSSAVAGLALLLQWYRGVEHKRPWLVATLGTGLCLAAAVGVVVAFVFNSPNEGDSGIGIAPLTEAEYRQKAGASCAEGRKEVLRVSQVRGQRTSLFGVIASIEKGVVDQLRALNPPAKFRPLHSEAVAVWDRRAALLESIYQRRSELSPSEFSAQTDATDSLAEELDVLFQKLGVPECSI